MSDCLVVMIFSEALASLVAAALLTGSSPSSTVMRTEINKHPTWLAGTNGNRLGV
jgi:hypothetical protein